MQNFHIKFFFNHERAVQISVVCHPFGSPHTTTYIMFHYNIILFYIFMILEYFFGCIPKNHQEHNCDNKQQQNVHIFLGSFGRYISDERHQSSRKRKSMWYLCI